MRSCRAPALVAALLAAGLAVAGAGPPEEGGVVRVPGSVPEVVVRLGALDDASAFAVAADGSAAAAAFPSVEPRGLGRLVLVGPDDGRAETLEVPGTVRALAYSPDARTLWAIVHRAARRGPGDAYLLSIDVVSLRAARRTDLPASALDLALLADRGALVVACDGELRTFEIPGERSGLLFVLPGANHSVAAVPGTHRVLVGRGESLILVDLRDPQSREGMPVRESVVSPGAVSRIAVAPDGSRAAALVADGTVLAVRFDPLRADPDGRATAIAWPGAAIPVRPEPLAPERAPEPLTPPPQAPVSPRPPPPATPPPPPTSSPPRVAPEGTAIVRGTVSGAARAQVAAIVLYGPDNLLREAARVVPEASGAWSAVGLVPGHYRVVPDGGGARQLVCEPPFQSVEAVAGEDRSVPDIDIVRSY